MTKCRKCAQRFYTRDEDGDIVCVACGTPARMREHEEPVRDADALRDALRRKG